MCICSSSTNGVEHQHRGRTKFILKNSMIGAEFRLVWCHDPYQRLGFVNVPHAADHQSCSWKCKITPQCEIAPYVKTALPSQLHNVCATSPGDSSGAKWPLFGITIRLAMGNNAHILACCALLQSVSSDPRATKQGTTMLGSIVHAA